MADLLQTKLLKLDQCRIVRIKEGACSQILTRISNDYIIGEG